MAREHELLIPPQFVLLLKTLIHVEGLGRELYPALDIWSLAKPLLKQWLEDRIGPRALMRRIKEDTPIYLAGMPDLPQLAFDALTQMRQQGQWQSRQLQALSQLQDTLLRQRRHDVVALSLVVMGSVAALAGHLGNHTILLVSGAIVASISLISRMLAR
jgi:ubiquinone biosynthesis protein